MPSVAPEINVRIDNRLYDEVGDSWWRADSLLYQLKASLNPVRLAYARRKLFDELRLEPRGKQALEVGCGDGLVCEEIARLGFEVTGIDPSKPSLAAATRHARSSGLAIGSATSRPRANPCRIAKAPSTSSSASTSWSTSGTCRR